MNIAAPRRRLARIASLALGLCTLALLVVACGPDPVERSIERMDELVILLETHKDDPDRMLDELETYVEEHEGEWAADRAEVDAMDEEEQQRLEARHERALHRVITDLYEVSLEIMVRLEDQPRKRTRFIELVQRIE